MRRCGVFTLRRRCHAPGVQLLLLLLDAATVRTNWLLVVAVLNSLKAGRRSVDLFTPWTIPVLSPIAIVDPPPHNPSYTHYTTHRPSSGPP